MRTYTIPLVALTLSLASGLTFAQGVFERHDNDGDGKLSKDEFYGVARDAGIFADYDANRDLRLDENEFGDIGIDGDFDTWDADNSGYLDTNEFYDSTYTVYDYDNDGYWDSSEWSDADDIGLFD